MTTILAPVAFSPVSARIVAHAGALARALRGRVLVLAVVVEPVLRKEYVPPPDSLARVMVGNEQAARRRLAMLVKRLARKNVPVTSVLLQGSPTQVILEQARKTEAALIVMGSHGHSAFYELIAGSTTQRVLRQTRCPVVIVPSRPLLGRTKRRTTSKS